MRQADAEVQLLFQASGRVKAMQKDVTRHLQMNDGDHRKGDVLGEAWKDNG